MNAMHGMVKNKNKEEVGRKMLVDGIRQAGLKKIKFLTLPSEACTDVLLLNKEFGENNVRAKGFERNAGVFATGKTFAPANLNYQYDSAGNAFMREATGPESSKQYNVIDFEFCGAYGSPNHATIEQIVKLVSEKVKSGEKAVIAATYNVSAAHFGKERSLNCLGLKPYFRHTFYDGTSFSSENPSFPIRAKSGYADAYILPRYAKQLEFNHLNPTVAASKKDSIVLAQAIYTELQGELMREIPLNTNYDFPFQVHYSMYAGGGDWLKQIMMRVVIVINPNKNTDVVHRQFFSLSQSVYPEWSGIECIFFPVMNFPLKNWKFIVLKYIEYYFKGNVPDSLRGQFDEGYKELNTLFGISKQKIAALHTTNMGTWRKNLRKSA